VPRHEAAITITLNRTLYDLLATAYSQIGHDEFIATIACYLFEREHSDPIIALWRQYYSENGLPFSPVTDGWRSPQSGSAQYGNNQTDGA
jgi:hypothetical protein